MKAKIDLEKFVRSLMERYYEKIHIDPTTTKCWLDMVLEDQGLEYKDGEIVEIDTIDTSSPRWAEIVKECKHEALEKGEELRKWLNFENTHEGITIPKDPKGTDTDGGVVGEKGEEGEPETIEEKVGHWQRMHNIAMEEVKRTFKEEDSPETKAIKEQIENLKKRIEDNQLGCIVQRLDKIIELLQSAILILPEETRMPHITYKRPLDPDPNVLGGWTTTASTFGSDYDIDTQKIKEDELNKPTP